jgi:hypothetical protein
MSGHRAGSWRLQRPDRRYRATGEHDLLGATKAKEAASALAKYRSVLEHAWFRFAADNGPDAGTPCFPDASTGH